MDDAARPPAPPPYETAATAGALERLQLGPIRWSLLVAFWATVWLLNGAFLVFLLQVALRTGYETGNALPSIPQMPRAIWVLPLFFAAALTWSQASRGALRPWRHIGSPSIGP